MLKKPLVKGLFAYLAAQCYDLDGDDMNSKNIIQTIWRSILCGLFYELFYELALAMRWATSEELYSFVVAAFAGVSIALIIQQGNWLKTFITTIGGLASAFVFHVIALYLNVPWKVLVHFLPSMGDIGHLTVNEKMTVLLVTVGYFFISFFSFLVTLGIKWQVSFNKKLS